MMKASKARRPYSALGASVWELIFPLLYPRAFFLAMRVCAWTCSSSLAQACFLAYVLFLPFVLFLSL